MNAPEIVPESCAPDRAARFWLAAAAVVLLAFGLRLAGFAGQSVWWDEYTSVMHQGAPTLKAFLIQNRTLDPATLPLYYSVEYLWWHHVHASIGSLRVLSALLGALSTAVLILFGRRLGGTSAGLMAGLCFAVSPIQIHHGQGVRMYVLFVLLALLASWSFLELLRSPTPARWAAVFACTLALSWTHPFALLLPFVQGVFLLVARPWPLRRFLFWCAVSATALLPVAGYLSTVRFWPKDSTSQWLHLPGMTEFAADLLGDDVLRYTYQLRVNLPGVHPRMELLILLLSTLLIAALLSVYAHSLRRLFSRRPERARREERQVLRYLWLWLIVPPTVLLLTSLAVRPCIFPRYTAHCAAAAYLMAGMAVAASSRRWQRWSLALFLPVLIAAQWGLTLTVPQRTDWRGAARAVLDGGKAADPILVLGQTWAGLFRYNQGLDPATSAMPNPVAGAETPDALARAAAFALQRHPDRAVWVVVSGGYFTDAPPEALETRMHETGLTFNGRMLPAIETLWVYRVTGTPAADPLAGGGTGAPELDHFTAQAFGNLGAAYARAGDREAALAALDALMGRSRFAAKVYGNLAAAIRDEAPLDTRLAAIRALWDGYGYRKNGNAGEALRAFAEACRADDRLAIAWAEQGLAAVDVAGAPPREPHIDPASALSRAAELDPEYAKTFSRLVDVLRDPSKGVVAQSVAAVRAYQEGQLALGRGENQAAHDALARAAAADPRMLAVYPPLAYARTLLGDFEGARAAMETYRKEGGAPDAGLSGNLVLICLFQGDLPGARAALAEAYALDGALQARYGALFDLILANDRAGALAEAERLSAGGTPVPPPLMQWLRRPSSS